MANSTRPYSQASGTSTDTLTQDSFKVSNEVERRYQSKSLLANKQVESTPGKYSQVDIEGKEESSSAFESNGTTATNTDSFIMVKDPSSTFTSMTSLYDNHSDGEQLGEPSDSASVDNSNQPSEFTPSEQTINFEEIDGRKGKLKKKKTHPVGILKLSPSEEWELRKQIKEKKQLSQTASRAIETNWKIRMQLNDIKRSLSKSVNTFYLETVNSGSTENLKALFNCCKLSHSLKLDKNYVDHRDYDALRIAIQNKDVAMCRLLLDQQVELRYNLFHAIENNFNEGVDVILSYDSSIDLRVKSHNYYFKVGLTPLIFAAHQNNYEILKLLYKNGHRLMKPINWWEGIHYALESSNERKMMYTAKSSPAYITLICEESKLNPLQFCFTLIKEIRHDSEIEHELYDFYKGVEEQVENYMCSLLDQVQSSEELSQLFEYEFEAYWNARSALDSFGNGATSLKLAQTRLELLDVASELGLFNFVTHHNSQLALSYIRYRYTAFLKNKSIVKRTLIGLGIGLMFPILSIFYIVAPKTKLGGIITLPNITYFCHLTSDVVFIFLLIVNVATKTPNAEFLGASPTALEWLIFFWILGKCVQEVRQGQCRGFRNYFSDWWNYIDLLQLILFAAAIGLRILDYLTYVGHPVRAKRNQWTSFEPRVLSSGFIAWAYIFVFLRILSLIRINRILGPLQVSISKMLLNVVQFFTIFGLVIFSFALALTELFWYYGTDQGISIVCIQEINSSSCKSAFSAIGPSLEDLFWSIFGYLELSTVPNNNRLQFVYWTGSSLLWAYHVSAVIILINTLIAMMAKSFDVTSENKEVEWKFHRTVVWIRFVRREFTRPPPMNLFPNPYAVYKQLRRFKRWLSISVFHNSARRGNRQSHETIRLWVQRIHRSEQQDYPEVHQQLRELESSANQVKEHLRKSLSNKVTLVLLERYKFGTLLHESNRTFH